jgi:hypothetical protein
MRQPFQCLDCVAKRQQEVEDEEKSEGFWRELFLLKPDVVQLRQLLEDTDADFLLHMQVCAMLEYIWQNSAEWRVSINHNSCFFKPLLISRHPNPQWTKMHSM